MVYLLLYFSHKDAVPNNKFTQLQMHIVNIKSSNFCKKKVFMHVN